MMDSLVIEVLAKEGVYLKHDFLFWFFFVAFFIINAILERNLSMSVEVVKKTYINYRDYIKKRKFLVVIMRVFSFTK